MKLIGFLRWLPKPKLPVIGASYYHKDRDPFDLIEEVIPQKVEGDEVTYTKIYKDPRFLVDQETTTIKEFNKWFRMK